MKKVETIGISKQQSYVLTLQAIILLFIGGAIFSSSTGTNDFRSVGYVGIFAYLGTIIIHELLHGIGFMLSGARPKFGVGIAGVVPVAYATSDTKIRVPGMLFTAYLPFVVLSAFFLALARVFPQYQALAMIGFLGNFTGAVGDLWIAGKLWKYLRFNDTQVLDRKAGLEVFSDSKLALALGTKSTKKSQQNGTFGKRWAISSLAIIVVQLFMPVLVTLLGFEGNFRLGFKSFFFFEMTVNEGGSAAGATFNFLVPLLLGLIFAMVAKIIEKKPSK
ncbi:MAG: DUF3267 domain-containing protein [Candidatus Saccharimonadales bacterium]